MRWPDWLSPTSGQLPTRSNRHDGDDAATAKASIVPGLSTAAENAQSAPPANYSIHAIAMTSVLSATASVVSFRLYRAYLRRIPNINYLSPSRLRKRSVYGYVTSVGDGDNFRLYHTPGGKLAGWGWLPGRRVQAMKKVTDNTIHVRIAGVDAPEMAHFGRPAQPYSREALDWLRSFVLRRYVRVYPYRRDQYDRVVCTVYRSRWGVLRSDVGLNMLQRGLATVYEAKFGSEFGNQEATYRAAEDRAKRRKVGMWQEPGIFDRLLRRKSEPLESPRAYKTRMAKIEAEQGTIK